ncbi:MAG: succinate--CoA ligase subunit alpha [Chloroflexi bacterium]|jgi:succinyl-CoA synthetase alpha subunit|nr:succinate--CoA ligase subunit alpha [Chloroflexota bacterium]
MSILVDAGTRLLVQGITGREGAFHTRQMLDYGTQVVAGVTPGKGGQVVEGVPVYDDVRTAVERTGANTSIIYVPAAFAVDAILEAADAGIALIVCITEGVPLWDAMRVMRYLEDKPVRLLGPNCPGIITPGASKVGIMPGYIHRPGKVGVVSRSGTLTYEVVWALTRAGLGQSTCLGIGGDALNGISFVDVLRLFEQDPQTEAIVLIGEIGGNAEEQAAAFIADHVNKPVVALVAGRTAPPGRRMGHAGAIIAGSSGTASHKIEALREVGVLVADQPDQIPELLHTVL